MNPTSTERIVTVAVDVQNDFCPDGALAVTDGDQVVTPLNDAFTYTREHGGQVVATRDWHPAITPHFAEYGGIWPVHCVAETEGAELRSDLEIDTHTIIVNKGTGQTNGYSGFEGITADGQTLAEIVRPKNAREKVILYICGLATDYCVLNTALDAAREAQRIETARQGVLEVYLLTDAVRGVNIHENDSDDAIKTMVEAGVLLTTARELARN
jgi:nicotinamidase/pyrazinamidase